MTFEKFLRDLRPIVEQDPTYTALLARLIKGAEDHGVTMTKELYQLSHEQALLATVRNNKEAFTLLSNFVWEVIQS